jgi:EAL domain-containing protein (putative c-di-GMP-specific phosphodiesterase class I)
MEPDQILRDADVALYEAKEHIGSAVIVYTESMITRIQHALDLERRLRKGLARDEFWVAYQPIFDLADQRFLGYEALARWTSEDDETILPRDFVAVAESAGLLDEIGRGVISKALEFHATCPPGTLMFVNMAPSQIAADGIVEWFQATLARSGADATSIYLEITEMTAFTDYGIQPRLEELRALGIRVALDDFGVGHSSLASLHNLSVDLIKVAPSFLADATHDARAKVTARMVCELGATLGIDVIAEGVETPEHLQILTEIGCTLGQGFFLGEPRPAQTATQYLPG